MPFQRYLIVAAIALSLAAQTKETFKARLSATPADARTRAALAGSGTAAAKLEGTTVSVTGSFEGLLSPATSATLNLGVAAGVRGPVVGDLTISKATSGTISGSATLTSEQLEKAKKGGLYILIDSEKAPAPDGVLWGWLLP